MNLLTCSLAQGPTDTPLIDKTVGAFFDEIAAKWPDREAVVSCHENARFTYRELKAESDRLASGLLKLGIAPGDRVGIWSHNNMAWLLLQLATAKAGMILVNLNPAYRTAEVEYALNKAGCKALVTMTEYKTSNYLGMLRELIPELDTAMPGELRAARAPDLRHIVWIDTGQPDVESGAIDINVSGMSRFSQLLASGHADDQHLAATGKTLKATDPINIQFTSGTTGFPKGATLTHRNVLNNGFFVGERMKLTQQDRLCVPVPLYHCFGMVMGNLACVTHGATVVYPNDGFDPVTVLDAVQTEKCTGLYGVPTMFIAELNHPRFREFDLSTLRTGVMAGAPCPIEVMKQVVEQMHLSEITIAYGMTETSPAICQTSTDAPLSRRVSTVGTVLPHIEVKIIDPANGEIVAPGVPGEICARGYAVMHGYWEDEAGTNEAIDKDHWMHTGDLGTMDVEGYVNVVGRSKDMVIRGGENIYPAEIEAFLHRHPKVQDVQVVGLPDKKYGEELCAWLIVKPGEVISEDEIREFCRGQIAHFMIPAYIRFVSEFPMTVTGKIQKFMIRELMKKELGLDEEATA
ncbi:MAG: acyl-CoA ligase [Bradyrhizobium sp.]|nr:acyl-CoA ligase [Bradyrhizobium sp.]